MVAQKILITTNILSAFIFTQKSGWYLFILQKMTFLPEGNLPILQKCKCFGRPEEILQGGGWNIFIRVNFIEFAK